MNAPAILRRWEDCGVLVVAPQGALDIGLSTSLWHSVVACLAEEPAVVVVDLTDVRLEWASVAIFPALARLVAERGATRFGVCGPSPEAARLLDTMGVTRTVAVWRSVTGAVEHARHRAPELRIDRRMASSSHAPALARMEVVDACRRWSVATDATAAAAIVMSELVTNAVMHVGGDLQVSLELAGTVLTVAVQDHSSIPPRMLRATAGQDHGRGLAIVAELTQAWGSSQAADGGKVVWARLSSRDGPRPRAGGRRMR